MPDEHLPEIVEQVPAVRDLNCVGRALRDRASVLGRAVACDNLDARVSAEPRCDGRRRPVWEQVDRWSERIHREWTRNLLADRPDLTTAQLARTQGLMEQAFPDAEVVGFEAHEAGLMLPDADDWHVLAAAVEAGAGEVVTMNLRDFPEVALRPLGIEAIGPDAFVESMVESDLDRVVQVPRGHRAGLRKPPLTEEEYWGYLERAGLPAVSGILRAQRL